MISLSTLATLTQPDAASYAFDPKELEALRKADEELTGRINSIAIIRFGAVLVLVFLFASGLRRQSDSTIRDLLATISNAQAEYDTGPSDPLGLYIIDNLPPVFANHGITLKSEVSDKDALTADQESQALQAVFESLKNQYRIAFLVKVSILGTDLSFDLRTFILALPLWLPFFHIYTHILKDKRRILRSTAFARIEQIGVDKAAVVDRLVFRKSGGTYGRYPDLLVDQAYAILLFIFAGIVFKILSPKILSPSHVFQGIPLKIGTLLLASAFYSSIYASAIVERMRKEVEGLFHISLAPAPIILLLRRSRVFAAAVRSRLPTTPALLSSGFILLLTLALSTAEVGCYSYDRTNHHTYVFNNKVVRWSAPEEMLGQASAGFRIFTREAEWPPAVETGPVGILNFEEYKEGVFGKILYILLLALGTAGIFIGASPLLQRCIPTFILSSLRWIGVSNSLLLICEFAGPCLLPYSLWLFGLAIVVIILILMRVLRNHPVHRATFSKILMTLLISFFMADLIYLVSIITRFVGLVILFFAAHVVTLGFIVLLDRRRAAT